jgi:hypothetical protein
VGVDGLQPSDYPIHIRQWRPRAIASDDSIFPLSYGQVDMTHADLRKVWEQGGGQSQVKRQADTTQRKLCPWG